MLFTACLALGACGHDAPIPTSTSGAASAPSKAALVGVLRELLAALEAGDAAKAIGYLHVPASMSQEVLQKSVGRFLKRREISGAGIDRLAADGKYGPLEEILPGAGAKWVERSGLDLADCYAFTLKNAQVAAFWTGTTFKLLRLDDVGKLK